MSVRVCLTLFKIFNVMKVLPDIFKIGFSMMRVTGIHPDRLYFGILPLLQIGQYLVWSLLAVYFLFTEMLCSETMEDIATNAMGFNGILFQVSVFWNIHTLQHVTKYLFQCFFKVIICILNKRNFRHIIDEHNIWTIDDIFDDGLKTELTNMQVLCYRIQNAYRCANVATVCFLYVPVLLGRSAAPFGTLNCLSGVGGSWYLIIQTGLLWQGAVIIAAMDVVFIGGCVTLIVQLRIASSLIANMDYAKNSVQLRSFIEHYARLLKQ